MPAYTASFLRRDWAMNAAPFSPFRMVLIVGATSLAFVVCQLDVTIVNLALPRIGADLGMQVAGLQWVVDAYTLAFSALMLSAGALGDRFGGLRGFVAGLVLFAAASLGCGVAPSGAALIAARALQGAAAAAMLPSSLALLNHACAHDGRLRARAVGWWTAAGAIAIAAGPVLGGLLLASTDWRGIFFVNLPLCAAGILLALRYVPETERHRHRHGLDLRGQLLAVLTLTALTGSIIALRPLGARHPLVLGGFAVAVVAGPLFVAAERRAAEPMLPLALFRNGAFSAAVLFGVLMNFTYYGTIFVLSLYLQRVLGYPALRAGFAFLPLTAGFFVSNVISGPLVARFGSRLPMMVGAALGAVGYALLGGVGAHATYSRLLLPFLVIPAGMGLGVPAMTTAVLALVEKTRSGIASAVLNTARQAGGAIGVAAFGALAGGDGATPIVAGLHASALISTLLLAVAGGLGARVKAVRQPAESESC